jgi:hypothetical protein
VKRLLLVLVACHQPVHPPDVPRTCTEPETRESVSCAMFDFEVRFTRDGDAYTNTTQALSHAGARTTCGCIRNLAAAVDEATREGVHTEVLAGCHCTRER